MRELLVQFIVPLTFLAIWALTSILNRDAQPLPQRPRRPGERGPDPAAEARRRREEERAERRERPWDRDGDSPAPARPRPGPSRPAAAAPSGGSPKPKARPASLPPVSAGFDGAGADIGRDEVVFLDSVTNRGLLAEPTRAESPAEPRPPAPAPPRQRKSSRSRREQRAAARPAPVESETRRALSDQVGRALETKRARPLEIEIQPLAPKLEGLTVSLGAAADLDDARSSATASQPAIDARSIQEMFAESRKLREVAVLSEILQPPVSLRRRRF